jgi:hypothetical protein
MRDGPKLASDESYDRHWLWFPSDELCAAAKPKVKPTTLRTKPVSAKVSSIAFLRTTNISRFERCAGTIEIVAVG